MDKTGDAYETGLQVIETMIKKVPLSTAIDILLASHLVPITTEQATVVSAIREVAGDGDIPLENYILTLHSVNKILHGYDVCEILRDHVTNMTVTKNNK